MHLTSLSIKKIKLLSESALNQLTTLLLVKLRMRLASQHPAPVRHPELISVTKQAVKYHAATAAAPGMGVKNSDRL